MEAITTATPMAALITTAVEVTASTLRPPKNELASHEHCLDVSAINLIRFPVTYQTTNVLCAVIKQIFVLIWLGVCDQEPEI
jgi:hypothetical protein